MDDNNSECILARKIMVAHECARQAMHIIRQATRLFWCQMLNWDCNPVLT